MKITKTELSKKKAIAEAVMAHNKDDHDLLLYHFYDGYLMEHHDILTKSVAILKNKGEHRHG